MVGEKVKALRLKLNWSQKKLEEMSGVQQSRISELESGRTKVGHGDTLAKLAAALGTTVEELIKPAS